MTTAFPMIEKAVKQLVLELMPDSNGKVGGDLSYSPSQGFYIWIGQVPGAGRTDRVDGSWAVDISVFANSYAAAMQRALSLEALLIGPLRSTQSMRFDNVFQNTSPHELPWDDESVYRVSATYVFTARRSG